MEIAINLELDFKLFHLARARKHFVAIKLWMAIIMVITKDVILK